MSIHDFIDGQVKSNDVVVFMKGTPQFPMCGFSGQVAQIFGLLGVDYKWFGNLATGDVDAKTWNTTANWTPSGVPLTTNDTAEFSNNFTANRTVTLDVDRAVRLITLNDPKPQTNLTIQGTGTSTFRLDATNGLTLNPTFNNTLSIASPSGTSTSMLTDAAGVNGNLVKNGLGTVKSTLAGIMAVDLATGTPSTILDE